MLRNRTDNNHAEITHALRKLGATVQSLTTVKRGCPDILVGWRGRNYLFEIKSPGGKLNDLELKWAAAWNGQSAVVYTLEQILSCITMED